MAAVGIPAAYIRGGTSKAVFFHARHIPAAGPARDRFLKKVMGTPNQTQVDGMGGSRVTTSKVAIIQPSERADADVDYTFAQVGITDDTIGYDGNCGNISSAVGSFAIDEGLVQPQQAEASPFASLHTTPIRIFNTGTAKVLISHTPFNPATGRSVEAGDYAIAGVGGTGAPILMDYQKTIGSARNKGILPSGNVVDRIHVDGKELDVTISDAGNATVIFKGRDIGLTGHELAADLTADKAAISTIMEIRAKAAHKVGMCTSWQAAEQETPFFPFIAAVFPADDEESDIRVRLVFNHRCHDAMAGTSSIALAAASRVAGSVADQMCRAKAPGDKDDVFRIRHPLGVLPVYLETEGSFHVSVDDPKFAKLAFVRTARRIMDGKVYVPSEDVE